MVISRGQALSVMRFIVQESAANTLSEQAVNTAVQPAANIAMRVWHAVLSDLSPPDPANPAADALVQASTRAALSTRQGLTTMPTMQNAGCFAAWEYDENVRSQAGDTGVGTTSALVGPFDWDYAPAGLLIGAQQISAYILGSGNQSVRQMIATVFYTLETLSPGEFFSLISVIET